MVKYTNWWGDPKSGVIQDSWFTDFFKRCCEDFIDADHNLIHIYSVFGDKTNLFQSNPNEYNLYFTGENTYNMHTDYQNENEFATHMDSIVGFFKNTTKSIRLPLWCIYWRFDLYGCFNPIQNEYRNNDAIIVTNHSANGIRNAAVQIVSETTIKIDCNRDDVFPNQLVNKIDVLPDSQGKIQTCSNYKYNICCENSLKLGYTTEKCFEALAAGCIPIYFGENPVESKVLNQDNIIHLQHFPSIEEFKNKHFQKNKVWKDDAIVYIFSTYNKLWSDAVKKLGWKQRIFEKEDIQIVNYQCICINDAVDLLISHWIRYKNFHTPMIRIKCTDQETKESNIYYKEDLADICYEKYNL